MKRLIYAIIIILFLVSLTFYSHYTVDNYCNDMLTDVEKFSNQKLSSETLTHNWTERKEKMSMFVNHDFLDQITLYIGQITLGNSQEDENFWVALKNIETLLSAIKADQRLAAHSFY